MATLHSSLGDRARFCLKIIIIIINKKTQEPAAELTNSSEKEPKKAHQEGCKGNLKAQPDVGQMQKRNGGNDLEALGSELFTVERN